MDRRAFVASVLSPLGASALGAFGCEARRVTVSAKREPERVEADSESRARVLESMKRATRFMTEVAAHRGGYVWSYLPDFSRSWGELEARRSMLWVQPPGTPSVGHLLLDAYHATGDVQYSKAAGEVATALIAAQHSSGGWNYVYDFAGRESLDEWYRTVAQNAWRMEEFHLHPDSATFDDAVTAEATQFLLRMQVERATPEVSAAVTRAIQFVQMSQYPNGGWPQRFPLASDYTRLVTFNDDVLGENIKTLLMVYNALGRADARSNLRAAMDSVVAMQQPAPQAGWGLQHDLQGKPAAARSFEPAALATHTTAANIALLIMFHELTADRKYTARVPEALDWLDRVALSPSLAHELGGTHPTFIEMGTNEALHVHRRGSNVWNGEYYVNKTIAPRLAHYTPVRTLDVPGLRARLASLKSRAGAAPLLPSAPGSLPLPKYFSGAKPTLLELCSERPRVTTPVSRDEALRIIDALDNEGRWLGPLELLSNPYRAPGTREAYALETYASTNVGDRSDTSPYGPSGKPDTYPAEAPLVGISVRKFIQNMSALIAYVAPVA